MPEPNEIPQQLSPEQVKQIEESMASMGMLDKAIFLKDLLTCPCKVASFFREQMQNAGISGK